VIFLNGVEREWRAGEPVAALLELLGLPGDARGVAVAVDGEVVPRAGWHTRAVPDGAHVEVLTAMQGG
jgi:sulfur carrier protein